MSMTPDERKAWAYERLDAWLLVNRWADLEDFIAQVTEVLEVEGRIEPSTATSRELSGCSRWPGTSTPLPT